MLVRYERSHVEGAKFVSKEYFNLKDIHKSKFTDQKLSSFKLSVDVYFSHATFFAPLPPPPKKTEDKT